MTRVPPQSSQDGEHSKAATVFTGIMMLLGGWGGLALAGVVLGFDYLVHGQPDERDQVAAARAEHRRNRYTDALAWLEADRLDRERARKGRREWFAADPASRGNAPGSGESFGRVMARVWNNLQVGWTRFKRGWQQGRDEAQRRREGGGQQWWRRGEAEQGKPETTSTGDDGTGPQPGHADADTTKPGGPAPDPAPADDEAIDAEIVPAVPEPDSREVVPVGEDEPAEGPGVQQYESRLDDLRDEIDRTRGDRIDDPSPHRSSLV